MDRNIYQRGGAYLRALCTALVQVNMFWQNNAVLFFDGGAGGSDDDDIVVRYFLFCTLIYHQILHNIEKGFTQLG